MNYNLVPTTVFTPLEYGVIGLSEEAAKLKYGDENIEVYHMQGSPYEQVIIEEKGEHPAYLKLIANKLDKERIVGFHVLAPNAGEITQGFSLGLKYIFFYSFFFYHSLFTIYLFIYLFIIYFQSWSYQRRFR